MTSTDGLPPLPESLSGGAACVPSHQPPPPPVPSHTQQPLYSNSPPASCPDQLHRRLQQLQLAMSELRRLDLSVLQQLYAVQAGVQQLRLAVQRCDSSSPDEESPYYCNTSSSTAAPHQLPAGNAQLAALDETYSAGSSSSLDYDDM